MVDEEAPTHVLAMQGAVSQLHLHRAGFALYAHVALVPEHLPGLQPNCDPHSELAVKQR